MRSSSADAVQLITRRSSMLLSLIESEEKRIHDLMELHPSQNPAHHHRASVHRPHRGSVLGGSQRGSQLKTATAAAALASALSRGSSVLPTDSASQGGTPQGSCRGSRKMSASAETALAGLGVLQGCLSELDDGVTRVRCAVGAARTAEELALVPAMIAEYGDLCNVCVNVPGDDLGLADAALSRRRAADTKRALICNFTMNIKNDLER